MPPESEPPELPALSPVVDAPAVEAPAVEGEIAEATAAVAGAAIEPPGHAEAVHTHCENCGTHLEGPWCHRCGQHDFEFHRSFRHVFWEAMESFLHFEGKFFGNIIVLLFRPGRLTAEFNAGKRAGQMPPFRLYLFVSVLFFFLVFLGKKPVDGVRIDEPPQTGTSLTKNSPPVAFGEALADARKELAGNPAAVRLVDQIREGGGAGAPAADAGQSVPAGKNGRDATAEEKKSGFEQWAETQGRRAQDPVQQKAMVDSFLHSLPKMLLFCLPFFALFTRVLFRKSGQVYLQHLVLALHFHTFIFLWVMTRDGWDFLAGFASLGLKGWVLFGCNLWLVVYPALMLRRLFANSWPKTLMKTALLALAYALTLGCAFVMTAIILLAML